VNHYPHHIGDFNNATRHLTRVERSLYRDLIDLYYDTEQALISDVDKLARKVLATSDEEKTALAMVLDEFFTLTDDGFHNDRCDQEIASYRGKIGNASNAGKASAAARANKKATGVERALNKRTTNQNQNQNQVIPLTPKGVEPAGFAEFWNAYPNHSAKANAVKAWGKVPAELHPAILAAVESQKQSAAWTKDDGQYVPHAATWLNGKRWEDGTAGPQERIGSFI
jgi:uncharacterized protein YdaU (DUF1376 family)